MKRILFLASILLLPVVTYAAPRTYAELANLIGSFINAGTGVALTLGIVVYFYGIASNMHEASTGSYEKMRTNVLWGMIALFVMFSVWGILGVLRNTLFGGGYTSIGSGGGGQVLCTSIDCKLGE